jgi:hypothetical protein
VLFVESPGSIAELGAFAASDALRPKTLAVLNDFYPSDRSFITDGPVQKIREENPELIHYYEWNPKQLNSRTTIKEFSEMARDLTEFLRRRDNPRHQGFDRQKNVHALLMVADLVRIAGVATTTEIADCLKELGCDLANKNVSRYLSLLESMSLVTSARRSNQKFYISQFSKPFVRFAYQHGAPLKDHQRIKTTIRAALDPIAKKVLEKSLRKPPKKGLLDV